MAPLRSEIETTQFYTDIQLMNQFLMCRKRLRENTNFWDKIFLKKFWLIYENISIFASSL